MKTLFDFHIAPDPTILITNPIVFKPPTTFFQGHLTIPGKIPVIGKFGFGTKGYTYIIEVVQKEFDQALICFNYSLARFEMQMGQGQKHMPAPGVNYQTWYKSSQLLMTFFPGKRYLIPGLKNQLVFFLRTNNNLGINIKCNGFSLNG